VLLGFPWLAPEKALDHKNFGPVTRKFKEAVG